MDPGAASSEALHNAIFLAVGDFAATFLLTFSECCRSSDSGPNDDLGGHEQVDRAERWDACAGKRISGL